MSQQKVKGNPYLKLIVPLTHEGLSGDPDSQIIVELYDKIGEDGVTGEGQVVQALLARLGHPNPTVQLYSLILAELLVADLGIGVHKGVASKEFTKVLQKLVTRTGSEPAVKDMTLGLIEHWAATFDDPLLAPMRACFNRLIEKGYYSPPPVKPAFPSEARIAMPADTNRLRAVSPRSIRFGIVGKDTKNHQCMRGGSCKVHKNNYVEDGTFTLITASYTRNKESEGEAATIATPPECWTKAVLAHAGIRGRESLSDIPGYDQIEDRALKKSVDVRIHALFRPSGAPKPRMMLGEKTGKGGHLVKKQPEFMRCNRRSTCTGVIFPDEICIGLPYKVKNSKSGHLHTAFSKFHLDCVTADRWREEGVFSIADLEDKIDHVNRLTEAQKAHVQERVDRHFRKVADLRFGGGTLSTSIMKATSPLLCKECSSSIVAGDCAIQALTTQTSETGNITTTTKNWHVSCIRISELQVLRIRRFSIIEQLLEASSGLSLTEKLEVLGSFRTKASFVPPSRRFVVEILRSRDCRLKACRVPTSLSGSIVVILEYPQRQSDYPLPGRVDRYHLQCLPSNQIPWQWTTGLSQAAGWAALDKTLQTTISTSITMRIEARARAAAFFKNGGGAIPVLEEVEWPSEKVLRSKDPHAVAEAVLHKINCGLEVMGERGYRVDPAELEALAEHIRHKEDLDIPKMRLVAPHLPWLNVTLLGYILGYDFTVPVDSGQYRGGLYVKWSAIPRTEIPEIIEAIAKTSKASTKTSKSKASAKTRIPFWENVHKYIESFELPPYVEAWLLEVFSKHPEWGSLQAAMESTEVLITHVGQYQGISGFRRRFNAENWDSRRAKKAPMAELRPWTQALKVAGRDGVIALSPTFSLAGLQALRDSSNNPLQAAALADVFSSVVNQHEAIGIAELRAVFTSNVRAPNPVKLDSEAEPGAEDVTAVMKAVANAQSYSPDDDDEEDYYYTGDLVESRSEEEASDEDD